MHVRHDDVTSGAEILRDGRDIVPAFDGEARRRHITEIAAERDYAKRLRQDLSSRLSGYATSNIDAILQKALDHVVWNLKVRVGARRNGANIQPPLQCEPPEVLRGNQAFRRTVEADKDNTASGFHSALLQSTLTLSPATQRRRCSGPSGILSTSRRPMWGSGAGTRSVRWPPLRPPGRGC